MSAKTTAQQRKAPSRFPVCVLSTVLGAGPAGAVRLDCCATAPLFLTTDARLSLRAGPRVVRRQAWHTRCRGPRNEVSDYLPRGPERLPASPAIFHLLQSLQPESGRMFALPGPDGRDL